MFDFSFFELVVVFVVALVVLGPTRLPGLVRKVGRWVGKARAMAHDFRQQLENEVNLDELNRMTERQSQPGPATTETPEPAAAAAETPADASLSGTSYPYGTPTDTGSMAVESTADAHRNDDTYSHAHAAGGAPQPWNPEGDGTAPARDPGQDAGATPPADASPSDPSPPGSDKQGS